MEWDEDIDVESANDVTKILSAMLILPTGNGSAHVPDKGLDERPEKKKLKTYSQRRAHWNKDLDNRLASLVIMYGSDASSFQEIAAKLPGMTWTQCKRRWENHLDPLRKAKTRTITRISAPVFSLPMPQSLTFSPEIWEAWATRHLTASNPVEDSDIQEPPQKKQRTSEYSDTGSLVALPVGDQVLPSITDWFPESLQQPQQQQQQLVFFPTGWPLFHTANFYTSPWTQHQVSKLTPVSSESSPL